MRYTARENVFETNSSSVHAIVIDTRRGHLAEDDIICANRIELGDFGWTGPLLTTPEARASYIWTALWCLNRETEAYTTHEEREYGDEYGIFNAYGVNNFAELQAIVSDLEMWKYRIHQALYAPDFAEHTPTQDKLEAVLAQINGTRFPFFEDVPNFIAFDEESGTWRLTEEASQHLREYVESFGDEKQQQEAIVSSIPSNIREANIDHVEDTVSLLRALQDDSLLHDFLRGRDSFVCITNDNYDLEFDFDKLKVGDILTALEQGEMEAEWTKDENNIVEVEKGLKIYMK